jgi:ribosomal protein L3
VTEDEARDHANGRGLVMRVGDEAGDLRTGGRVFRQRTSAGQMGGRRRTFSAG